MAAALCFTAVVRRENLSDDGVADAIDEGKPCFETQNLFLFVSRCATS
jgi:hypothetical protein